MSFCFSLLAMLCVRQFWPVVSNFAQHSQ